MHHVVRPGLDIDAQLDEKGYVVEAAVLSGDVNRPLLHLVAFLVRATVGDLRVEAERQQSLERVTADVVVNRLPEKNDFTI